jgi:hypothetical protein
LSRSSKADGTTELALGIGGYIVTRLFEVIEACERRLDMVNAIQWRLRRQNTRHAGQFEA